MWSKTNLITMLKMTDDTEQRENSPNLFRLH